MWQIENSRTYWKKIKIKNAEYLTHVSWNMNCSPRIVTSPHKGSRLGGRWARRQWWQSRLPPLRQRRRRMGRRTQKAIDWKRRRSRAGVEGIWRRRRRRNRCNQWRKNGDGLCRHWPRRYVSRRLYHSEDAVNYTFYYFLLGFVMCYMCLLLCTLALNLCLILSVLISRINQLNLFLINT